MAFYRFEHGVGFEVRQNHVRPTGREDRVGQRGGGVRQRRGMERAVV
jgi:hypothetical protein